MDERNEVIKVLLVDDEYESFIIIQELLARSTHSRFNLKWVVTYEEGVDAIRHNEHDVYLVDWFLDNYTGLDLLLTVQEEGMQAAIILLTSKGNDALDAQAMNAGASFYLDKQQITPVLLERTIRYALEHTHKRNSLQKSLTNLISKRVRQAGE